MISIYNLFYDALIDLVLLGVICPVFLFYLRLSPEIGPRLIKNEDMKEKIRKEGIIHATSDKGMNGILESQKILCSKGIYNYCSLLVPCVYFSPCNSIKSRKSNREKSYTKEIVIIPSEEQINKFMYRRFDGSILYEGEFKLSEAKSFECRDYKKVEGHCFSRICTEVRRNINYLLCGLLTKETLMLFLNVLLWWLGK